MKPLELDYLRGASRLRLARYLLAVVAIGFAADTSWYYTTLKSDISRSEERFAHEKTIPREVRSTALPASVTAEEYLSARETIGRLSTPWDRLFQALESAQTDRIALLAIEPDADQRSVKIMGEARDYLAALSYVASLSEQKTLQRVHLIRHEPQTSGLRPLAFTISASWKDAR